MNVKDCIKVMVRSTGCAQREVSRRLGRNGSFISVLLARDNDITVSTLLTIAGACGWEVQLRKGDITLKVD